ncbi:MAG TPA: hypothetical protein VH394_01960 [Thermoanaerobaculia bacterium]|jgi:hypothetical protein|nr:hypothetical protein [Thermoanaerobaculia bacterium]
MRKVRLDRAHLRTTPPERTPEPLEAARPSHLEPQKLRVKASRLRMRENGER